MPNAIGLRPGLSNPAPLGPKPPRPGVATTTDIADHAEAKQQLPAVGHEPDSCVPVDDDGLNEKGSGWNPNLQAVGWTPSSVLAHPTAQREERQDDRGRSSHNPTALGDETSLQDDAGCGDLPERAFEEQKPTLSGEPPELRDQFAQAAVGRDWGEQPVLLVGVNLSNIKTLKDADLARLADVTTIKRLELAQASCTGDGFQHLRRLTQLRLLNMQGLAVKDEQLAHLRPLTRLEGINLQNVPITDAGLKHLSGLRHLTSIHLGSTKLSRAGLEQLTANARLETLDLRNTRLGDEAADVILKFPKLRTLSLEGSAITDEGVQRLARRKELWHHLHLANTQVSQAALEALKSQLGLGTLDVSNTRVTPEAFEAFVKSHPIFGMTPVTENTAAPDRRVAQRVLAAGAHLSVLAPINPQRTPLSIRCQDHVGIVTKLEKLPAGPFRIQSARCGGIRAITNETLAELGKLEFLEDLSINQTAVTDAIVDEVAKCPQLRGVSFGTVKLSPAAIDKLLTSGFGSQERRVFVGHANPLRLHDVGLTPASARQIGKLTRLTELDIGSNLLITDDEAVFLEQLPDLEHLVIATTKITGSGWKSIAKLPKLKQLSAHNMPVIDETLSHIRNHPSLEFLHVNGDASEVGDSGLKHIATLRSLRNLGLGHCRRVTDAGLVELAQLPALEKLQLLNTRITDAGLKHLHGLKTLRWLDLSGCQLTPAALDDLQDALPWCRIVRP